MQIIFPGKVEWYYNITKNKLQKMYSFYKISTKFLQKIYVEIKHHHLEETTGQVRNHSEISLEWALNSSEN